MGKIAALALLLGGLSCSGAVRHTGLSGEPPIALAHQHARKAAEHHAVSSRQVDSLAQMHKVAAVGLQGGRHKRRRADVKTSLSGFTVGKVVRVDCSSWSLNSASIDFINDDVGGEVQLHWQFDQTGRIHVVRSSNTGGTQGATQTIGGWPLSTRNSGPVTFDFELSDTGWNVYIGENPTVDNPMQRMTWFDFQFTTPPKVTSVVIGKGFVLKSDPTVISKVCSTRCAAEECAMSSGGSLCKNSNGCFYKGPGACLDTYNSLSPNCCTGVPDSYTPQSIQVGSEGKLVNNANYLQLTCQTVYLLSPLCNVVKTAATFDKVVVVLAINVDGTIVVNNPQDGSEMVVSPYAMYPAAATELKANYQAGLAGLKVAGSRVVDLPLGGQSYNVQALRTGYYVTRINNVHQFTSQHLQKVTGSSQSYELTFSDAPKAFGPCTDSPTNWKDSNGQSCGNYKVFNLCVPGSEADGWYNTVYESCPDKAKCTIEHFATNGISAFDACCACGGGVEEGTPTQTVPTPASPTPASPTPAPMPTPAVAPTPAVVTTDCSTCFTSAESTVEKKDGAKLVYLLASAELSALSGGLKTQLMADVHSATAAAFASQGNYQMHDRTNVTLAPGAASSPGVQMIVLCWAPDEMTIAELTKQMTDLSETIRVNIEGKVVALQQSNPNMITGGGTVAVTQKGEVADVTIANPNFVANPAGAANTNTPQAASSGFTFQPWMAGVGLAAVAGLGVLWYFTAGRRSTRELDVRHRHLAEPSGYDGDDARRNDREAPQDERGRYEREPPRDEARRNEQEPSSRRSEAPRDEARRQEKKAPRDDVRRNERESPRDDRRNEREAPRDDRRNEREAPQDERGRYEREPPRDEARQEPSRQEQSSRHSDARGSDDWSYIADQDDDLASRYEYAAEDRRGSEHRDDTPERGREREPEQSDDKAGQSAKQLKEPGDGKRGKRHQPSPRRR